MKRFSNSLLGKIKFAKQILNLSNQSPLKQISNYEEYETNFNLSCNYLGTLQITKLKYPYKYITNKKLTKPIHVNRMKPWHGEESEDEESTVKKGSSKDSQNDLQNQQIIVNSNEGSSKEESVPINESNPRPEKILGSQTHEEGCDIYFGQWEDEQTPTWRLDDIYP